MALGFKMRIGEFAQAVQGRLQGQDAIVHGITTDTRSAIEIAGTLFIALKGKRFDGHAFITQAREQGAAAVLLEQTINDPLPQIEVRNTRIALGQLGSYWRQRFECPVVAVTGSNGKTTVKEMIAAMLNRAGPTLVTQGNLNNDIGVPLTLLKLDTAHHFAVIEMGANRLGEIGYLSRLACPQVAVITNAGPAHLDGFRDLSGVAQAKGEIFQGIYPEGVAVLNRDDPNFAYWRSLVSKSSVMDFGLTPSGEITADNVVIGTEGSHFSLITPIGRTDVQLPLLGRHNILNALAATAAAITLGLNLDQISMALASLVPVSGRLQFRRGINGMRILDDTYNANPASLKAALELLNQFSGERFLVLGDFAELGAESATLHRTMGRQARAAGVSRLYTLGHLSICAAEAFGNRALHFTEQQQLLAALQKEQPADVTLLIKGSRCMHMEQIVAALCGQTCSFEN
ncbi:UDP-N-acetylmuramoylalanyl-D-glutamyl-2,6-diaminopimelate/D-alanyl-D-alanyl ligase [Candidatus Nitrosoglobus terrae]|uniref:UDP-N-acetylmuramoyl-tripeptide--D-alanyl-D-alanine ligase n=1 Tax=Candidatus Nitrosoglobus terrae TaxID=1630141 RepID=A0A1Q2SKF8_9GAMM|nr:UDP-N-acetylmuramoyl-tripeptide--D-alanyl-D-alanine ligase [Candidatus Nitrosoglobus terrae]BAW79592.1 UDP-N-acetylmuramoylalanyl-D-glutamyl-2,6-diaminopimelate/D-alanyl-D-alanyl ligase [Candidatus Nitrosoglobus terrae]